MPRGNRTVGEAGLTPAVSLLENQTDTFGRPVVGLATGSSAGTANAALIQAAIDAAATAGGGTVVIPVGEWFTAPLRLKTRVRLVGTGWASRLKLAAASNTDLIRLDSIQVEQTAIQDLWLDGNKANQSAGSVVKLDNIGYVSASGVLEDVNHVMRRVMLVNGKTHGLHITASVRGQSQFVEVWGYDCDQNNFRIDGPDNQFLACISKQAGRQGFYMGANGSSLLLRGCKSFLSGFLDASNGNGFHTEFTSYNEFDQCEAQDNRGHGFAIIGGYQMTVRGKSERNGLGPEPVVGGFADGIYSQGTRASIFDMILGDRASSDGTNPGDVHQNRGYNLGTGMNGNIVRLAIGATKSGVRGVGSWGAGSSVVITFGDAVFTS